MQPGLDPTALLSRVAFGQGPLSAEEVDWMRAGLRRWMTGQEEDLPRALGLHGGERVRARNAALCRAAVLLDVGQGLGRWPLAEALAQRLRRFEAVHGARIRAAGPDGFDGLDRELALSLAAGARPLRSARRIFEILPLTNEPGFVGESLGR